ncbi:MAG: extracellular solute-binding protein [Chloroflexi bacterium]|nr:extracellular solute-binding protein [Chloroflexota bacterium]
MATKFNRGVTRRDLLRGVAAAAALPIVAACSTPAAPAPAATTAPAPATTQAPKPAATTAPAPAATSAPVAAGAKPFAGKTINVSIWSSAFPKMLADYIPEFEQKTGMKVNYQTPAFAVYNQQADMELSTKGSAYDVANITFIYTSRWINAGWFTPLDDYFNDPNKTPAEFNLKDFLAGAVKPHQDKAGKTYGLPWIADVNMAAAGRFDIVQKAGFSELPKDLDGVVKMCEAINKKEDVYAFLTENHYGWQFPPFVFAFGGKIFRNPPDDLMPMLDSPECQQAVEWYANLIKKYGPDGALSYTYDQATQALQQGRANYTMYNHVYVILMADEKASKVAKTVRYSELPAGPKGSFPGVATHAMGIPLGSKNKDAAWEFIKWGMSKEIMLRTLVEKSYGSQTRQSVIDSPEFKKVNTVNGQDVAKIYLDSINKAATGYMAYRTIHVFPQVDQQIDKLIQNVVSGAMSVKDACAFAQTNAIAELKKAGITL